MTNKKFKTRNISNMEGVYTMSSNKGIKGLLVKPNEKPCIINIPLTNQLEFLQKQVGGLIDVIGFERKCDNKFDYQVDVIINDEGRVNGLPLNRAFTYGDISQSNNNEIFDICSGSFIILGGDASTGNFISLPNDELQYWFNRFYLPLNEACQYSLENEFEPIIPFTSLAPIQIYFVD